MPAQPHGRFACITPSVAPDPFQTHRRAPRRGYSAGLRRLSHFRSDGGHRLVTRRVSSGTSASQHAPVEIIRSAVSRGDFAARLGNLWWERRLRISTRGVVPVEHHDSVHYATMN